MGDPARAKLAWEEAIRIHAHGSIWFRNFAPAEKPLPLAKIAVTNNLLDNFDNPVSFWRMSDEASLSRDVRIQNNIFRMRAEFDGVTLSPKDLAEATKHWQVGHNCFSTPPPKSDKTIPLHAKDVVKLTPFLSFDPKHADYLRTAADGPLATGGGGGNLPGYIGPLPPGPAPKDGDWFSRLHAVK